MVNNVFKYLEYLLPAHNCIILPDFGGFIIEHIPALLLSNGELIPPRQNIIFNPDLNHNDGVLVSYYIKNDNIPYNTASLRLKDFTRSLKQDLLAGKVVKCSNLGFLSLDEHQNIVFTANRTYGPDYYGLTSPSVRRIADINKSIYTEKHRPSLRYKIGGVAAAALALFLFAVPSVRINNGADMKRHQQSGFVEFLTKTPTPAITSTKVQEADDTSDSPILESKEEKTVPSRTYYIIIGGEDSKTLADRLLKRIQTQSFPNAAIVESGERYRIYVASFTDKAQAETYLEDFRRENPKYETAWLFSKRK